jgi:hypothetical protein
MSRALSVEETRVSRALSGYFLLEYRMEELEIQGQAGWTGTSAVSHIDVLVRALLWTYPR